MGYDYGREEYKRKRNERTKRAREQFMILVLLLALIPTVLSIILFARQAKLQKQITYLEEQLEKVEKNGDAGIKTPVPTGTSGNNSNHEDADAPEGSEYSEGNAGSSSGVTLTPAATEEPTVSSTPTPEPTPTDVPEPTAALTPTPAVDPDTGEALPWADKKIYLTFDDGPSTNTDELLDLLAEYDVKATFFVIGKTDAESLRLYKRIVDEGHTIGMHSYSHDYAAIYKSVEDFEKDFTKISDLLYDTIGYVPDLYRFPGGSSNSKCKALTIQPFISFLQEKNIRYFDWNVENGDATGVSYTVEELAQNLLDGVANKTTSVVLCHDTAAKTKTLESMKIVLPELKEKGAQVLPITSDTTPVRHVKPADE